MGTVVVSTFVTLDGVIQSPGAPDEDGEFEFGGWQAPYAEDDLGTIMTEWFTRADAFLLGRRTYEIFAGYWPTVTGPDDPIASPLNVLPKYVASTTLTEVEWNNSSLIGENIEDEVAELRRRHHGEIQVHGSSELIQTLRKLDLVDEYRLWTYPVVLGHGKRLFPEGAVSGALKLVDSKITGMGATVNTYRPVGKVTTGSFG